MPDSARRRSSHPRKASSPRKRPAPLSGEEAALEAAVLPAAEKSRSGTSFLQGVPASPSHDAGEEPPPPINPALAYIKTLHPGASQENARSKLNCVARWAGCADLLHCNWSQMRYEHVLAFIVAMQEKDPKTGEPHLSSRSICCYLSALKGVAKQAFLLRQIGHEALTRIQLIRSIRYARLGAGRSISEEESRELLAAQDDGIQGARDHAILCLLLGCGLRRAEAAGLLLRNVNEREESLTLIGKGEKERKVFLMPQVMQALQAWLSIRGPLGKYVFGRIYKNGRLETAAPMTPHAVGDLVRKYQRKASLEHLSTHDLRRTFATRLLDASVDITTVQRMMGHASIATTALYDRRGENAQRRAARKIKL